MDRERDPRGLRRGAAGNVRIILHARRPGLAGKDDQQLLGRQRGLGQGGRGRDGAGRRVDRLDLDDGVGSPAALIGNGGIGDVGQIDFLEP